MLQCHPHVHVELPLVRSSGDLIYTDWCCGSETVVNPATISDLLVPMMQLDTRRMSVARRRREGLHTTCSLVDGSCADRANIAQKHRWLELRANIETFGRCSPPLFFQHTTLHAVQAATAYPQYATFFGSRFTRSVSSSRRTVSWPAQSKY